MSQPPRPNPDPLNREIEAALEGMSLQDLDASPTASSGKTGGRSGRNENGLWRGTVVGIHGDDVIVELGPRAQGVCAKSQFDDVPEVGQRFEFSAHGQEDGLWLLSRKEAKQLAAWDQVEVGARVQAKVTGQNTGGLELKIGPLSAFMPASQTALSREENLAQYIGQNLECLVLEIDREKKRVLLSRRAILEEERESARKQSMGSLVEGAILRGKVTRIEPFGAFVDIGGGVEGLLHVSNLSRRRVQDPNEVLHKGQEVQVKILEIKEGGKRIGLGMKQLEADPWHDAAARFGPDQVVTGRVTRVAEFGAFVELEPGLEGLLHVSQLSKDRVRRAQDVLKPNQEVTVRVQSIEPARQRISLSRLDSRGAVLGSDEAVESSVIEEALSKTEPRELGTNLGNLFKRLKPSSDQRPQ